MHVLVFSTVSLIATRAWTWIVIVVLLVPALASAADPPDAIPKPVGWIGTTDQWTTGLGIALALLNLAILFVVWRNLRGTETTRIMGTLLIGLVVLPVVVMFFGYNQGMSGMETVRACGDCHAMTSHVQDLRDPNSESLAATHFKNRFIREDQCYTCHSDYGMLGTVSAKMSGIRHVYHYVTGTYSFPLKIARPYPNLRCLECHGESQKFLKSEGHPSDLRPQLISGEVSCLTCHGPAHTPKEAKR